MPRRTNLGAASAIWDFVDIMGRARVEAARALAAKHDGNCARFQRAMVAATYEANNADAVIGHIKDASAYYAPGRYPENYLRKKAFRNLHKLNRELDKLCEG